MESIFRRKQNGFKKWLHFLHHFRVRMEQSETTLRLRWVSYRTSQFWIFSTPDTFTPALYSSFLYFHFILWSKAHVTMTSFTVSLMKIPQPNVVSWNTLIYALSKVKSSFVLHREEAQFSWLFRLQVRNLRFVF